MTRSSNSMQAYYAARAPYYDAVYLKPERREDIAFLKKYLPSRLAARSVLEVACGTGYWTQYIAPAAHRMVATDATPEPIAFAKLRPGTGQVEYVRADAYALPPELGEFSAAFAGLWLSHVPVGQRARFFSGLHARLSPGARVILIDNAEVQCRELPIIRRDREGNTYQDRKLKNGTIYRVLKNFPSEAELRTMVRSAAASVQYRELENFWLLEYELRAAPCLPSRRT